MLLKCISLIVRSIFWDTAWLGAWLNLDLGKAFKSLASSPSFSGCALRFHKAPKAKEISAVVLMWPCCDPVASVHSYVTKVSACMAVLGSDVSWTNTPVMAYMWSGFWNQFTCDFRLLHGNQCSTAESAVASHGWCILRLKAWNVGLDREKRWTIELFIWVVLFLDLEMVFFRRLKLNMAAHSLNWNPCFLLDSSCIQPADSNHEFYEMLTRRGPNSSWLRRYSIKSLACVRLMPSAGRPFLQRFFKLSKRESECSDSFDLSKISDLLDMTIASTAAMRYLKQASACARRPGHLPRGGKLES